MWRELRTRSEAKNLENLSKTERSSARGALVSSGGFMTSRYRGLRRRRVKAQNLKAKEKERYFVSLYVKEGAVEEKIPYAERRASLKPGTGQKILQRKKVQEEINARMEPMRVEQMRQQLLGDAAAAAHEILQNDLTKKVARICKEKTEVEVLDHELMRMVVGLEKHPKAKLAAIITAYVVIGTLETNRMRRARPRETITRQASNGMYTSLFERMNLADGSKPAASPYLPDDKVCEGALPLSGESIDDLPTADNNQPSIITVKIG